MFTQQSYAPSAALTRGIALAFVAYAAFSTADAIIKLSSERFVVGQTALILAIFALLPTLALTIGRGGMRALLPKKPGLVAARAALTACCCQLVWNALTMLPIAEVYAILFASPMLITAASAVILGEDVGWRRWSAVITGFVGVLIMLDPSFASFTTGHLLVVLAAVCGSASFLVLRKLGPNEKSAPILAALFLAIGLTAAPSAISGWITPSPGELAMMALAGLLIGSGQTSLVLATREAPAALVAPFQYSQMIWAVLFGIWLFGDLPTPNLYLGLVIVTGSGLFIVWRETIRNRPVTIAGGRGEVPARAARDA